MAKRVISNKISTESLPKQASLYADVWDVVRQIPKGKVTSYGAIATYLGPKMSARMVGWAMGNSKNASPAIPAQRVVNRNGELTAKHQFESDTTMQDLLQKDGVHVQNDKIIDFKNHFWDPSIELSL